MIRAAQAQAAGKRYPQIAPVLNEQSRRRVAALGAHVGTSEQREFSAVDQDSSIVGATSEADRGREVFGSGLAERGAYLGLLLPQNVHRRLRRPAARASESDQQAALGAFPHQAYLAAALPEGSPGITGHRTGLFTI